MTTTASISTKLGVRKITARIGAEITGVRPDLELDPGTVTAIRAALNEHKALVFRGIELDDDGQQRILRILQHYVTRPENILRVSWEPGQLVLFDNRITQHYAIDNYDDQPRRLNRVTVAGDVPVGIDGQKSYSVKGDASHYTPVAAIPAAV